MLTVTDDAKVHLANLLEHNEVPDGTAVRLVVAEQGLAMTTDSPGDQDATFDHDGRTVLVMENEIAEQLDGRTLDVEQTDDGTELKVS